MSDSYSYTLAIYTNDKYGIFHILTSTQTELRNISISNMFSKSNAALNGKDSSQAAATTSFLRVLASTEKKDWDTEYVKLGEVSNDEVNSEYEYWFNLLVEMGYKCVSRNPRARVKSGNYSGKEWKARKIENMTRAQVKKYAVNMLEDCRVEDEILQAESNRVTRFVLAVDSEIENISQMWSYVFHSYAEGMEGMKKAA
jgi:hypothetical protein